MDGINAVVIEGTVTRNAVAINGRAEFGLEVPRHYKGKDGSDFVMLSNFTVCIYSNVDTVTKNVKAGKGVRIMGRLEQQRYELGGEESARVVIVADSIEIKGAKN